MNKKVLFINITFLLAIVISIIFIKQFMDNSTGDTKKNDDTSPDAYMINACYLRTNETGKREVVLFTPQVTHFSTNDTSHFLKPVILFYKDDEQWQITSSQAQGIKGVEAFYLYDNVRAKQLPSKRHEGTLLLTKSLTVHPKKNVVFTNDPVIIEQPGLRMNAVGLKGDLNTGKIQLLSRTRGRYDPNKTH